MDAALLLELLSAAWREIQVLKMKLFFFFALLSFAVLAVGFFWAEKYETSTKLYADVTNIIQPLLAGRAEVTKLDPTKEAADIIYTRKMMTTVAEKSGLLDPLDPLSFQASMVKSLRSNVVVRSEGSTSFRVSYTNTDPDISFRVLTAVVDEFIRNSVETKQTESRSAYEFIDQQVVSYKKQLIVAENNLKEFKAKNLDGSEETVNSRINQLRIDIEENKLTIAETESRQRSLKVQLKSESQFQKNRGDLEAQQNKLQALQSQLDVYRLSYQDGYPDIVAIKEQISAIALVVEAMTDEGYFSASSSRNSLENPLYEELRKRQAEVDVNLMSQKRRMSSMEGMLKAEYARAKRVASREAEMSELVRDYDVTQEIYEEMLGRKEKARLSMALDIEGQGVSFKIQEPAVYPLAPTGLHFVHFALAGPLVGFAAVIGLIAAYILLDPRVRSPILMVQNLPANIELLATIPHINSSFIDRFKRRDMIILFFVFLLFAAAYATLAVLRLSEAI